MMTATLMAAYQVFKCFQLFKFSKVKLSNFYLILGMEDVFKDHLEKLLCFLFPNGAVEPKIVAGTRILASDLAGYIESYVNLLNSDEGLSPLSIFQVLLLVHLMVLIVNSH